MLPGLGANREPGSTRAMLRIVSRKGTRIFKGLLWECVGGSLGSSCLHAASREPASNFAAAKPKPTGRCLLLLLREQQHVLLLGREKALLINGGGILQNQNFPHPESVPVKHTYHRKSREQRRGSAGSFQLGSAQVQLPPGQGLHGVVVGCHQLQVAAAHPVPIIHAFGARLRAASGSGRVHRNV